MDLSLHLLNQYNPVVVLGPTASGKTRLAARLAVWLDRSIISADSRQVYKELHIGCGKDPDIYRQEGYTKEIFGINLCSVREMFYLHQYRDYLYSVFNELKEKGRFTVLCGGTGLYLDCLRKTYPFTQIPVHEEWRNKLEKTDKKNLLEILKKYPEHCYAHADLQSKKRIIRAIEVADFLVRNSLKEIPRPGFHPFYLGIFPEKQILIENIRKRLAERWNNGMKQEIQNLLQSGISPERLIKLGLEYKWITLHLLGQLSEKEMLKKLETEICRYSRRQLVWFRKMEKEGVLIHKVKSPDEVKFIG